MKIIYETELYTIKEIPFNYKIDIKKNMVAQNPNAGIERDWYSPLDWDKPFKTPLELATWVAEETCKDHFRPITPGEVEANKLKGERLIKINLAR
jgi:hypothetical protein